MHRDRCQRQLGRFLCDTLSTQGDDDDDARFPDPAPMTPNFAPLLLAVAALCLTQAFLLNWRTATLGVVLVSVWQFAGWLRHRWRYPRA